MPKTADTCQIRLADEPGEPTSLVVHALREDGGTRCGFRHDAPSWENHAMRVIPTGRGVVTCTRNGCR
jgi:hypothetical protein